MFLDNLFTLWKFVQALKERGIVVTETIRKSIVTTCNNDSYTYNVDTDNP